MKAPLNAVVGPRARLPSSVLLLTLCATMCGSSLVLAACYKIKYGPQQCCQPQNPNHNCTPGTVCSVWFCTEFQECVSGSLYSSCYCEEAVCEKTTQTGTCYPAGTGPYTPPPPGGWPNYPWCGSLGAQITTTVPGVSSTKCYGAGSCGSGS